MQIVRYSRKNEPGYVSETVSDAEGALLYARGWAAIVTEPLTDEQILQRRMHELLPMRCVNPARVPEPQIDSQILRRLFARCGPMVVVAGPTEGPGLNNPVQKIAEPYDLLSKTGHVRKWIREARKEREETILEFIARTGLSPGQIRSMSKTEIKRFVEQAEANNENDVALPHPDGWSFTWGTLKRDAPRLNYPVVDVGWKE